MVLLKMKETAEAYLGTKVNDAAVASAFRTNEGLVPVFECWTVFKLTFRVCLLYTM